MSVFKACKIPIPSFSFPPFSSFVLLLRPSVSRLCLLSHKCDFSFVSCVASRCATSQDTYVTHRAAQLRWRRSHGPKATPVIFACSRFCLCHFGRCCSPLSVCSGSKIAKLCSRRMPSVRTALADRRPTTCVPSATNRDTSQLDTALRSQRQARHDMTQIEARLTSLRGCLPCACFFSPSLAASKTVLKSKTARHRHSELLQAWTRAACPSEPNRIAGLDDMHNE